MTTKALLFIREVFLPNTFTLEAGIAIIVYVTFAVTVVIQTLGWGIVPSELVRIVDLFTGLLFGRATKSAQIKVAS